MMTEGALCKANPAKQQRDAKLVAMRMDGATLSKIESKLGYSKGHLSRLLNHDKDIKALIEEASKCQAAMLPKALERHAEILTDKDAAHRDVLQAIKLTYLNTSVSPSHTQSITINNLLVQQQTVLDPALLQGFGQWFMDGQDDAVEGELVPTIKHEPNVGIGNDTSD